MAIGRNFYVTFRFQDINYLALIIAPQAPPRLHFQSYDELRTAMEALGEEWWLQCETPQPQQYGLTDIRVWQTQLAACKTFEIADADPRRPGIF